MARSRPRPVAVVILVLVAAIALAACGNSPGGGASAAGASSAPVTGSGPGVASPDSGPSDSDVAASQTAAAPDSAGTQVDDANLLTPVADLDNVRATPWQRVTGTGRDLVVQWTSTGLAPCSLLSRVDVAETASTVTVTVHTGESPGVKCGVAPQVGLPLAARVTLDADRGARAVVDGAR